MVIGFDGSRAFINNTTGTENYSYQILRHLSLIDHKNQYIVFIRPLASKGEAFRGWPKNFQFKVLPYPRLWTQLGLSKETFSTPMNVLFIPSHTLPIIHKPGLKTVLTVHDLGAEYLPKAHQLKQQLYLKLMTHHQLKTATHLIAVSKATKKDIISKVKIPSNKISVIYEGYDKKLFKPQKIDVLKKTLKYYDLDCSKYFLFVGTIQPRKNLERLIKAYADYVKGLGTTAEGKRTKDYGKEALVSSPNALSPLILAGSKGWMSDDIYKLPKKLGIEQYVKFLGFVPDKDLPVLYCGAMALTFPSLFEGFGLPIIEAMACGCPVLTSNVSSMTEVAGEAAVLVNPNSTQEITSGMQRIKNQAVRIKLIKAGFEQAKKFSWEKAAKETLKVLENSV